MDRLHKKCLIASLGTHSLLLLVLVFGSAFFVAKKPPVEVPSLRVVPGRLVEALVSGGGGNPQIQPSPDKIKGDTLLPQPLTPPPKAIPQPPKAEPPKLALKPATRKAPPAKSTANALPRLKLNPVNPAPSEKSSAAKDTVAARQRHELAEKLGQTVAKLRSGFEQGTAVDIQGPGGEAFANYALWVKQVYQDAWLVTDDMEDEQATAKVSVTIARSGEVLSSQVIRRSGNAVLDGSVERTLSKVRFIRPFPEGARDNQRTFIINFNLKAKRALG